MSKVLIVVLEHERGIQETVEIFGISNEELRLARSYIKDQDTLNFMIDIVGEAPSDISRIPYRFVEAHIDERLETLL